MQNSCSDDQVIDLTPTWESHLLTMCQTWNQVGQEGRGTYRHEIKRIAEALNYLNSLEGCTCRVVEEVTE
jgi:hypothetical protein